MSFETDTKIKIIDAPTVFKTFIGRQGLAGPISKVNPERQMVKLDGGMGLYFDIKELEAAT